ncbi:MAG TPA: hypothetical protein VL382_09360 [Terriglobales bacterium]|nr:hypothetical protein [Terriglobales bacterium]
MRRFPALLLALAALFVVNAVRPAAAQWKFAVSGDSRNCGDVVMPAIAADARREGVRFYWHLGDLRWLSNIDEDIANAKGSRPGNVDEYRAMAWQDFTEHQMGAWKGIPVFLGIGNHELYGGKTRETFLSQFRLFLDSPGVKAQRLHDNPNDTDPHTYYHWIEGGVDFVYLDNASADQFDPEQMDWLTGVLQRAATNPDVHTVVLGMHEPLPNSYASNHAMDDWQLGRETGTRVYHQLLDFKSKSHKPVLLIASHQHLYMPNVYDTPYWRQNGGVLPGWIVGSGGAHRYALPANAPSGSKTHVYGYLEGTVDGQGGVQLTYREIHKDEVPPEVKARYAPGFVDWCFAENSDK